MNDGFNFGVQAGILKQLGVRGLEVRGLGVRVLGVRGLGLQTSGVNLMGEGVFLKCPLRCPPLKIDGWVTSFFGGLGWKIIFLSKWVMAVGEPAVHLSGRYPSQKPRFF